MNDEALYAPAKPASGLYPLLAALYYLCLVLLVLAIFLDFCNGLGNFLHAPIGFKDDDPEPGAIVQIAQIAWIPLLVGVLLFGFLKLVSREFKTIPLLLGTTIFVTGVGSLVGGLLDAYYKGGELFNGQTYFTKVVTPVLWAVFIASWAAYGAYRSYERWKQERRVRFMITSVMVVTGLICAMIGAADQNSSTGMTFFGCGLLLPLAGYAVYIAPGKW